MSLLARAMNARIGGEGLCVGVGVCERRGRVRGAVM